MMHSHTCLLSRYNVLLCDSKYLLQRAAFVGPPDILVSTPACILKCFSANVLQRASIDDSLEILLLDEVRMQ